MELIIGSVLIMAIVAAAYGAVILLDLLTRDEDGYPR